MKPPAKGLIQKRQMINVRKLGARSQGRKEFNNLGEINGLLKQLR